jgi:hypothetical protein
MGRDKLYPEEFRNYRVEENAIGFLAQLNPFLASVNITIIHLRSGYRPIEINAREGGAKHSYHIIGKAVDLADPFGNLAAVFAAHPEKLRANQLWLENPEHTPGWAHLDCGVRRDRESRIFNP